MRKGLTLNCISAVTLCLCVKNNIFSFDDDDSSIKRTDIFKQVRWFCQ